MASSAFRVSQSRSFCPLARLIPTSLTDPVRFTFPCRQRRGASERLPLRAIVDEMRVGLPGLCVRRRDEGSCDEAAHQGSGLLKEPEGPPVFKWEPSIEGYLRFLVDSKIVYDTLETIIRNAAYPWCKLLTPTGGRMIGSKVAEKILDNKELEFYKWHGNLSELLQNVRDKLNRVASNWSREEKDHCLEETEKSFKYSGDILRLILS